MQIPNEQLLEMYQRMVLIRTFEETLGELFAKGALGGTSHLCIGEEASAQQDTANELRRDAVVAVRRLATAVEEATGAFQLGLEKLLQRLISNTKS